MGRLRAWRFLSAVMHSEFRFEINQSCVGKANTLAMLLTVALMLIPSLSVMMNADTASASDRARIGSLDHLSEDNYFFNEYILDPGVPTLGEEQLFSIWTRHPDGIGKVTATVSYMGSPCTYPPIEETVDLELAEGTVEEGRWQGSWTVKCIPTWYPNYIKVSYRAWNNEDIEGPPFSTLGVLSREGSPPEFEFEPEHEFDPASFPSSTAAQYSVSGGGGGPKMSECFYDPSLAGIGEMQIYGAYYTDSKGVQAVTATYIPTGLCGKDRNVVVDLKLVSGTPEAGWWMGAHVFRYPFDYHNGYWIQFAAHNRDGDGSDVTLSILHFIRPIIHVTPATIDLNSVIVGQASSEQTVTVSNDGNASLSIGTVTLTGTNADQFDIASDNASSHTIAPGASMIVNVAFNPTSRGSKSAVLSIPSNDFVNYTVTVALSGIGITVPAITTCAASSTMANTAILHGTLTSYGGAATKVAIFSGPSDGNWTRSDNLSNVAVGPFSLGVVGLTPNTTYVYRCYAENATSGFWADESSSFTTQANLGLWRNYWGGPGKDWFWFSSGRP